MLDIHKICQILFYSAFWAYVPSNNNIRSLLTSNCSFNTYFHIPFILYPLMMTYFLLRKEKCKTCHTILFDVEPKYFVTTGHQQKLYACSTAYLDACFILALILFYYLLLYRFTDSQSSFTTPSQPCAKYLQWRTRLIYITCFLVVHAIISTVNKDTCCHFGLA